MNVQEEDTQPVTCDLYVGMESSAIQKQTRANNELIADDQNDGHVAFAGPSECLAETETTTASHGRDAGSIGTSFASWQKLR
jgi:hypothetical protein